MSIIEKIPDLDELLKGRIDGEVVNQSVKRLTVSGDNYLSLILKLDIQVKKADDEKENTIETVIKLVPPSQFKSGMLFFSQVTFKNEIAWYSEVVPFFKEFEQSHGIKGFTDFYPKFYGGRLNLKQDDDTVDESAAVVLEFLNGYKNVDRFKGFGLEEAKDILVALARFHTLTIAVKELNPELFDTKIKPHIDRRPATPTEFRDKSKKEFKITAGVMDVAKELDEFNVEILNNVEKYLDEDPFEKSGFREPWATTTHSDFWVNNIMVSENPNPDIAPVIIIDFQMVMYESFAVDLMFFLLLSLENSVIETHLDSLIDFYYENFINNLKLFKVDTSKFTYEGYLEELKLALTEGKQLSHVLGFCNVVFRERGQGPDMVLEGNMDNFKDMFNFPKSPVYKEKVWQVLRTSIKKNWL